ncbi:MAG: hypothetical protein KC420_03785 [Myxococcales bacterium]|nr:hypothetical protein [Myxococcales bacterium]
MPTPPPLLLSLLLALGAGDVDPASQASETSAPPSIEVLRITRDFGKPYYDLALDAFAAPGVARIDDVRLHWVNTSAGDRRKPLGPIAERLVKVRLERASERAIKVTITGDHKEFTFALELREDGGFEAYVAAITEDGQAIPRCRATKVRLIARRVLGIAAGLERIAVECADISGRSQAATIEYRDL